MTRRPSPLIFTSPLSMVLFLAVIWIFVSQTPLVPMIKSRLFARTGTDGASK